MSPAAPMDRALSSAFVAAWREAVAEAFGHRRDGAFLVVPPLVPGTARQRVYLPLLTYGDLTPEDGQDLGRREGGRHWTVRCLDPARTTFSDGMPVTLRLSLEGGAQAVWTGGLNAKCRNQVRKAEKSPLTVRHGTTTADAAAFHAVYLASSHRLGMPALPLRLFAALGQRCDVSYVVAGMPDGTDAAALVIVRDGDLAWIPWAGSRPEYNAHCPNNLIYWHAIDHLCATGCAVLDFGRSAHGGPTHRFKQQWGARPVGLALLGSHQHDDTGLYARYALAQKMWQHLPRALADRMGPWLCGRLSDL